MLISYTSDRFPEDNIPTVFDNYEAAVTVDGEVISLELLDTAGQENYDRMRPLSYPMTNVFLICFAVNSRASFMNVKNRWIPELKHHEPKVPYLLIGTKSDLRDNSEEMVSALEAEEMVKDVGAVGYLECSAREQKSLHKVFEEAIRIAKANQKKPRRNWCTLL